MQGARRTHTHTHAHTHFHRYFWGSSGGSPIFHVACLCHDVYRTLPLCQHAGTLCFSNPHKQFILTTTAFWFDPKSQRGKKGRELKQNHLEVLRRLRLIGKMKEHLLPDRCCLGNKSRTFRRSRSHIRVQCYCAYIRQERIHLPECTSACHQVKSGVKGY